MIQRQDFSNPLDNEIEKIKSLKDFINKENGIRSILSDLYQSEDDFIFASTEKIEKEKSLLKKIDIIKNEKEKFNLQYELRAKEQYLTQLLEKKELDFAATEEDYIFFQNSYNSIKERVSELLPVEQARANYAITLIELYKSENNKEACCFYFNALKMVFLETGIEV